MGQKTQEVALALADIENDLLRRGLNRAEAEEEQDAAGDAAGETPKE